jgi:hypothetical protein
MSGKIAMALTTAVLLSACNYETDLNLLQTVTNWNQVGDSPDQWLEQYSPGRSDWDKVALVFGFAVRRLHRHGQWLGSEVSRWSISVRTR